MSDVKFVGLQPLFLVVIVFMVGCQSFDAASQARLNEQAAKSRQVYSPGMCEAAVQMFASDTTEKDTVAAIQFVESAGVKAFPALLNHLHDTTKTSSGRFQRGTFTRGKDGSSGPYVSTVGDACFDVIHQQVEGCWPKLFRQDYVLNRSNVEDWLGQRADKTLGELRIECAELSLDSVERKFKEDSSDGAKDYVEFFADNLRQVRSENELRDSRFLFRRK